MRTEVSISRTTDLTIRTVIVGIPSELVNTTYLKWNAPAFKYQRYLNPGVTTGIQYRFDYDFVFPPKEFEDSFSEYLKSVGKNETIRNPFFRVNMTNTFYPANLTENWLKSHESYYGNYSEPAYTLVLANLTGTLPSATPSQYDDYLKRSMKKINPHYYNMTYVDSDLNISIRRRWMTSWGGSSRIYFIDLSAGPSNATKQLPIEWAAKANNITLDSPYGQRWLTQYLSDYIYGALEGLFAPDFLYPLNVADKYTVDILVIDNRTDYRIPSLNQTLNTSRIRSELERLLPYANIRVETRYANASLYSDLENLIAASTSPSRYQNMAIVDARPVHYWLNSYGGNHSKDLFNATREDSEYRIPVLAFLFTGEYTFGFTFKEDVTRSQNIASIWGVALGDVVLISHSSHDLIRGNYTDLKQPNKGFGLTQTIIHETGHMLGLVHPFRADNTQDFVSSVMAYYPYEYSFSQFDKDALLRGQADILLMSIRSQLMGVRPNILNQGLLTAIQRELEVAEKHHANMSYGESLSVSLEAMRGAKLARYLDSTLSAVIYAAATVFAVIVGVALAGWGVHLLARMRIRKQTANLGKQTS